MTNQSAAGADPSEKFHTENLFARSAAEIPRAGMPRVPGDARQLREFTGMLDERGMEHTIERVNPTLLYATQNELDGRYVTTIAADWDPAGAGMLLVSREGAVLDANHRWAAACVRRSETPDFMVTIIRVDAPINELLRAGFAFQAPDAPDGAARNHLRDPADPRKPVDLLAPTTQRPRSFASYGAPVTPCPDPSKPYVWIGEWALVATDTSDGIPGKLTFRTPT